MTGPTILELPIQWQAAESTHHTTPTTHIRARDEKGDLVHPANSSAYHLNQSSEEAVVSSHKSSPASSVTTTNNFHDLYRYIALGCIHVNDTIPKKFGPLLEATWAEMLDVPDEVKLIIGTEAAKLLDARWIRLFQHQPSRGRQPLRVYLLPEDWNRRTIDRNSKSLKSALRQLLGQIDISPGAWHGDRREGQIQHYDPWASAEEVSLHYIFNRLPSPAPDPKIIKSRHTRAPVLELLQSAAFSTWEEHGEQPLLGLRTRLYPYQARSASLMIQREAAPQLQLDPRLEVRRSPDGTDFFYGARDGSYLKEPRYYEANRGGILAESMGLGKTLISLAVILTTKGHYPEIPATFLRAAPVRPRVGSLIDMAASTIGRRSLPVMTLIEQSEVKDKADYSHLKNALNRNMPFYEIPVELPRLNRNTRTPPPQQLVICSGTIIVVPRNLLHQWQSEIQKHVLEGGLKILVVDSVSKRSAKSKRSQQATDTMTFVSELPAPTELMRFDVILFTRNRFEQEIQDGADKQGRRTTSGVSRVCNCPYIGATRISDCNCVTAEHAYKSPLKKLHWLRIIIDEGHSFSSSASNAVLVAKQIQAERRWVVSGTPAKNLVGVELDMATLESDNGDVTTLRETAIEQRKAFSVDDVDGAKAAKALGSLASNFLMVRPWCDSSAEGKLEWDEYVYRHEHPYKKTYSGFSSCFLRTLEGLVIKTRPEDVETDVILPPMTHRVVYLQPCWYDKMTANLFVQVLRANAITSERSDVDYLFHKNSTKARHSLIRNLRQSNFTWTGFRLEEVISTLETTEKYLTKEDKKCTAKDMAELLESSEAISKLTISEGWKALSRAHEVGMAVEHWPEDSEEAFALAYPAKPAMIGITQLLDGQLHVDSNILSQAPTNGLAVVGNAAKVRISAEVTESDVGDSPLKKAGVPSSCVGDQHSLTSHRATVSTNKKPPQKAIVIEPSNGPMGVASPTRTRKRKLTLAEEQADLTTDSPLRDTRVIGTTSAKLTYLLEKVLEHQANEKIIIFYDGDNAAFYIAQCLEMCYINHRIYARTLDNVKRSEYIALFNENPDVRVLLIDVACGALGLNLNAASVVLIVNPINRPGIEAQAIKRAHRIGQTKRVIVETLVLENTIEHAIFERAKKMSRTQHLEAKELEDDEGITDIIQRAKILSVLPGEEEGENMFAKLKVPQQVFGRPDRHKYHRYGSAESKSQAKPRKRAKMAGKAANKASSETAGGNDTPETRTTPPISPDSKTSTPTAGNSQANASGLLPSFNSIFGAGLI